MPAGRSNRARSLAIITAILSFTVLAAFCEIQEPRRPVFEPTPVPASPTPVYPSEPVDGGGNDEACKSLGDALSKVAKSNLRYGAELTFRPATAEIKSAIAQVSDDRLAKALTSLQTSIDQDDATNAGTAVDTAVSRCKQLGYRTYMAPFGFEIW
jgi:hypothetical protein